MKLFCFRPGTDALHGVGVGSWIARGIPVPFNHDISDLTRFCEELSGRCSR